MCSWHTEGGGVIKLHAHVIQQLGKMDQDAKLQLLHRAIARSNMAPTEDFYTCCYGLIARVLAGANNASVFAETCKQKLARGVNVVHVSGLAVDTWDLHIAKHHVFLSHADAVDCFCTFIGHRDHCEDCKAPMTQLQEFVDTYNPDTHLVWLFLGGGHDNSRGLVISTPIAPAAPVAEAGGMEEGDGRNPDRYCRGIPRMEMEEFSELCSVILDWRAPRGLHLRPIRENNPPLEVNVVSVRCEPSKLGPRTRNSFFGAVRMRMSLEFALWCLPGLVERHGVKIGAEESQTLVTMLSDAFRDHDRETQSVWLFVTSAGHIKIYVR